MDGINGTKVGEFLEYNSVLSVFHEIIASLVHDGKRTRTASEYYKTQ